jgi:2-polyprenyl-3-methyl-5-hydroxy-6-metoxy-1,4-benzoquinol methylase
MLPTLLSIESAIYNVPVGKLNGARINSHMTTERQAIADAPLSRGAMTRKGRALARQLARRIIFGIPPLRRMIDRKRKLAEDWDLMLSQSHFSTYLDGTIEINIRNSLTSALIRSVCEPMPSVLDVGCAAGSLCEYLPPTKRYLGIDISNYAIEIATKKRSEANIAFGASGIQEFKTSDKWDAIIMSEVLYYLSVDEAIVEVDRYCDALRPNGIIVVSMKNDAKSKTIFQQIYRKHELMRGIIWQSKDEGGPDYRIRTSQERPAFMVAAIRR